MEALYQMGKDLGALEARVSTLESHRCKCRGGKGGAGKPVPEEQKAILAEVRKRHADIVAGFGDVLRKLGLSDKVKVAGINLVDLGVQLDDEDQCCMCCQLDGQSGWHYCCDFRSCSSCC